MAERGERIEVGAAVGSGRLDLRSDRHQPGKRRFRRHPDPLGAGIAGEDQPLPVDDGHRRARGHRRLGDEAPEPGEVERGEDHRRHVAALVQDGVHEDHHGLPRDLADDVVADDEVAGGQRVGVVVAVGDVGRLGGRHRAAEDVALAGGRAEVGVARVLGQEIRHELAAARRMAGADVGQGRDGGEELPGHVDDLLLAAGGEGGQPHRRDPRVLGGDASLIGGGVDQQGRRRQHHKEDEEQQAKPEAHLGPRTARLAPRRLRRVMSGSAPSPFEGEGRGEGRRDDRALMPSPHPALSPTGRGHRRATRSSGPASATYSLWPRRGPA
jgi:hypothetical protein